MRHMCLSCVREALRDLCAYPLALGMERQLTTAGDAPGAPLRLGEPRPAQDRREVPNTPARVPATLPRRPAGAPVDRLLEQLRR